MQPAEHPEAPANCNLTQQQVADLQYATQLTNARLIDALVAAGKYNWQAWGAQDGVGQGVTNSSCTSFMSTLCPRTQPSYPAYSATYSFDPSNANQSIAAFLITRPAVAYIGFGWESDMRNWNDIFTLPVGEPTAPCAQIAPGVFSRAWSMGNATLNCNSWSATLPGQ